MTPQDTLPEEIRQWIEKEAEGFESWTPHYGVGPTIFSCGAEAMYRKMQEVLEQEKKNLLHTRIAWDHTCEQRDALQSQLAQAVKENECLKDEENAANNREDDACDRVLVLQRKIDSMSCQIQSLREAKGMTDNNWSYCQREIEGQSICSTQCEHCAEYYRPLEKNDLIQSLREERDEYRKALEEINEAYSDHFTTAFYREFQATLNKYPLP